MIQLRPLSYIKEGFVCDGAVKDKNVIDVMLRYMHGKEVRATFTSVSAMKKRLLRACAFA